MIEYIEVEENGILVKKYVGTYAPRGYCSSNSFIGSLEEFETESNNPWREAYGCFKRENRKR